MSDKCRELFEAEMTKPGNRKWSLRHNGRTYENHIVEAVYHWFSRGYEAKNAYTLNLTLQTSAVLFEDLKELGSAIERGDAQLIADRWISVKKGLGL